MINFRLLVTIILVQISFVGMCVSSISSTAKIDTIYDLEYVYRIADRKNTPANHIIDSLERKSMKDGYTDIKEYQILLAKGYIASRSFMPNLAIYYVKKALEHKSILSDYDNHAKAVGLLSNEYYVLNQFDNAVKYNIEILKINRAAKKYKDYATNLINNSLVDADLGNYDKALKQIHQARKEYILHPEGVDSTQIAWSYDVEAYIYMSNGKYKQAIDVFEHILEIYKSMSLNNRNGTDVEAESDYNYKVGSIHISLAMLYVKTSNRAQADKHYDLWKKYHENLPPLLSVQLYGTVVEYLKEVGKYQEALDYSKNYQNLTFQGDSINLLNVNIKRELSSIYKHLNDYKQAWQYEHEASLMMDSLYANANYKTAIEMSTIYETEKHQLKIIEQQHIISRNRMLLWGLSTLAVVGLVIMLIVISNSRKVNRKNRALFKQIQKLSIQEKKTKESQLLLRSNYIKSTDDDLFTRIERLLVDEQLFLKADVTRESIAVNLGTNKNYISNAIRNQTGLTFSEYLNQLKLEYAKELLLNNPDIKVEAVSIMSGFNSVRTFYRLFQKKYNLTPTEFKNLALEGEE